MRTQKGITLVALVITIIVLLILAGVTIAALGGSNGILTNATDAKRQNEIAEAKDQVALAVYEGLQQYYNETYVTNTNADNDTADAYIQTKLIALGTKISGATAAVTPVSGTKPTGGNLQIKLTSSDGKLTATGKITEEGTLNWE